NAFQHGPRGRIIVGEVPDELPVMVDRDALGDIVLPDHADEIASFGVLRRGTREQSLWIEIGSASELVDALGDGHHMHLFLFRVLRELGLYALARYAGGRDGMHRVAQHADDLCRQYGLKDG